MAIAVIASSPQRDSAVRAQQAGGLDALITRMPSE